MTNNGINRSVLFAYNGPLDKDDKGRFYGNELNDTLVERYKYFGISVTFLIRSRLLETDALVRLKTFQSENFRVVEVPEFNTFRQFFKNKGAIDNIIKKTVQEHDVVISRMPSYVGRKAVHYASELGKPFFIEVVGCPWDALWNHSWRGRIFAPLAYYQLKQTLATAPYVLYVTKEFLQKRYPSPGVQAAVSDVVLKPQDETTLLRRIEKIGRMKKGDSLVLGTAAAIDVAYKGQEYVIRAVAALKKENIHVTYKLVGRGDKSRLHQLAESLGVQDRVDIIGQIPHDSVFDFIDSIDLYIQPSKQEGLPRAMVEAMSRACPCTGAHTGGIPELLNPTFVFNKGNVNEIVKIIKSITPKILEDEAARSFIEAASYKPEILNERRRQFYETFHRSFSR